MDIEEVQKRVKHIKAVAHKGDDEQAHGEEDDLYVDVLRHIVECGGGRELAALALEAQDINFNRWCA